MQDVQLNDVSEIRINYSQVSTLYVRVYSTCTVESDI